MRVPGAQGRLDAIKVCAAVAEQVGCQSNQVMPFSTGVILEPLPVDKIVAALPQVRPAFWSDAARAIMTTDTVPKAASRQGLVGEKHTVRATGIAKGSGMIHPNMATMLSFIATDAKVSQPILQLMTQEIADESFNTITVDGDTSTNDSFVIMATGRCGQSEIDNTADPRYAQLKALLGSLAWNWRRRLSVMARVQPSSSRLKCKTRKPAKRRAKWLMLLPIRLW